jgi:hypothetical protein
MKSCCIPKMGCPVCFGTVSISLMYTASENNVMTRFAFAAWKVPRFKNRFYKSTKYFPSVPCPFSTIIETIGQLVFE